MFALWSLTFASGTTAKHDLLSELQLRYIDTYNRKQSKATSIHQTHLQIILLHLEHVISGKTGVIFILTTTL